MMFIIVTLALLCGIFCCKVVIHVEAYELCSDSSGGICPDGNTCCQMTNNSWGCIASDMGKWNATCCQDDITTGCPVGYTCRSTQRDCMASNGTDQSPLADPLTQVLPRYRVCNADEIVTVHGLPVNTSANQTYAEIPYYSNMGPLERIPTNESRTVDMALVVVHGASRNGDDYFCSAKATVALQDQFSNVLIIALNYYSASDDRPHDTLLYWDSRDTDGRWRYGADSRGPIAYSSFAVLDQVVTTVKQQFVNLQRITIAGHSSGGQLVQRWVLLSGVPQNDGRPMIQTVVANPSNYVYLSPHRFKDGAWTIHGIAKDCPQYDQWEWGLQDGGDCHVPYRDQVLRSNVTAIMERYESREVYYLVGGLDRCNVSESKSRGWCHSHGLETKCMDLLQGHNRFERNSRFVASLRRLGYFGSHQRVVVPGVGHDHSMMFQSHNGIQALYYRFSTAAKSQSQVMTG